MLQIDHIYNFFVIHLLKNVDIRHLPKGVPDISKKELDSSALVALGACHHHGEIFNRFLFYDQEPLTMGVSEKYFNMFNFPNSQDHSAKKLKEMYDAGTAPPIIQSFDQNY